MPRRSDAKPLNAMEIMAEYNERDRRLRRTDKRATLTGAAKAAINSARSKLTEALHYKRIIKPEECSQCGVRLGEIGGRCPWIEAHIPDYSKPLEVIWLCHRCNKPRRTERVAAYKAAVAAGGAVVAGIWVGPLNRLGGALGGTPAGPAAPLPGNVAPWKTLQAYSRKPGAHGQGAAERLRRKIAKQAMDAAGVEY